MDKNQFKPIIPADASAKEKPDYIFIRNKKEYEKVSLADIIHIDGDAEYLAFYIAGRVLPLREKSSFGEVWRLLSPEFVQIHRSNIVNMRHVSQVGKSYVVLKDGTRMRISNGFKKDFYKHVDARTVGKKKEPIHNDE